MTVITPGRLRFLSPPSDSAPRNWKTTEIRVVRSKSSPVATPASFKSPFTGSKVTSRSRTHSIQSLRPEQYEEIPALVTTSKQSQVKDNFFGHVICCTRLRLTILTDVNCERNAMMRTQDRAQQTHRANTLIQFPRTKKVLDMHLQWSGFRRSLLGVWVVTRLGICLILTK